ncbi:MAG TPA: pyridoxal-phosphate dependent enzyme, partial [Candidatus Dormibacteraeota bacterium]|nr:pyridoxal-phosphate dependent enzyme [Candidatus Dormibacteraeota bacterium]
VGAFKFRGAYNALAALNGDERARGVVAYSSGNHAQGVALAAQLLDIEATIVMPHDAPQSKVEATEGYGARVVRYRRGEEDREAIAAAIVAERKALTIAPYDNAQIVAGAGTAALELCEEVGWLDALVLCVGGGGLLSGSAIATHAVLPECAIWGVEPEAGDDFKRSLERGQRVEIPLPITIADGLQTLTPGVLTFAVVLEHGVRIVTVSDAQLRDAMRFAFERLKLVLEPSGAAALAALLMQRIPVEGLRVGAILTGGNISAARFAELMA